MTTPIRAPGRHPGIVRSTLVAAAAATAALVLGRTAASWAARDAEAFMTSGDLPVDGLVALLAVSAGAAAAAVLTAGCTLLAGASVARLIGRSVRTTARAARHALVVGRRLDQAGSRLTPLVVRRALVIGIGAGLGLAGPAAVATADEVDLGWAVTSTADPAAVPGPTSADEDDATATSTAGPSDDAAWAAWPVSSGSTLLSSPPSAPDRTRRPTPQRPPARAAVRPPRKPPLPIGPTLSSSNPATRCGRSPRLPSDPARPSSSSPRRGPGGTRPTAR